MTVISWAVEAERETDVADVAADAALHVFEAVKAFG